MKENEEIVLRARAKMDTCAGFRRVQERFDVKNTCIHCWIRQALHTPATTYQVKK